MQTLNEILQKYRSDSSSEHQKGSRFEVLMKNFLLTYPPYRGKFSDVWLWNDFPFKNDFGGKDLGIDLVTKTFDNEFWAVQCKFYAESSTIDKPAIDSFLATSSKIFDTDKKFSARIWISTTNNFTDNAEKTLQNQSPPVTKISLTDLQNATVDWQKLDEGIFGKNALLPREPLQHQIDAINATYDYFQNFNRGKLIMACGTGKTFTSLKIAEKLFPRGKILFLVPSISLLKQTLDEWSAFSENPFNYICVCSDDTVSKNSDEFLKINLPMPSTTDSEEISRRIKNFSDNMTVIFSTYQSVEKVADAKISFDLIICDEAHRTTGQASNNDEKYFTKIHSENFIHGKKRLYMTATPRLYNSDAKKKAADKDIEIWSMDDEKIYGDEIFHISFSDAIEKNLLSDYKVIVLTVNENSVPSEIQNLIADDKIINIDDISKLYGCINALQKPIFNDFEENFTPLNKSVAFCQNIKISKKIAEIFNHMNVNSEHIDGTMSAAIRDKKLSWLKNATDCRILTNVRCLSEGVDVPSLDAILFLSPRKSKVEIVQAVGRVMRKSFSKNYGYIIIPVVVPIDKNPEDALESSKDFSTIWDVLNALRAHDSRMDIFIEEIKLQNSSSHIQIKNFETSEQITLPLYFKKLQDVIFARMVERVGNRRYWEQWAKDIAEIAERHKQKILKLVNRVEFQEYLRGLRKNINQNISEIDAVEMLAQHVVTKPVFEALFENYSFVNNNAVSKSMQKIFNLLDTEDDNAQLEKFFDSVRQRCKIAKNAEDRQKIIIELYDKFFKTALPLTVERLGIVYTPVEVVDFILNSVNDVLQKNFGKTLSDKKVHVLDPFTGTGTFITRLIQSGLISQKDLLRKYQNEFHANEIILLAYYIAAINIENTFHDALELKNFFPFEGICFTDTFEMYERDEVEYLDFALEENAERVNDQKEIEIKIIIGNPPYSVGQKSANDNAQNNFYPKLENRISETYAKNTQATNKNSLYDSYIKAFRWASDRIGESGVIGFVTNAGWIDGAAMDGMRKCFSEEFSEIYIFNLRGNQRTQGEISRKEGGKIFGSGSRAPIAITILVKNPEHNGDAEIFYLDIGDYLSREEKLIKISATKTVLSDEFKKIIPNDKYDWINQRGDEFEKYIPLAPDKKFNLNAESFFIVYSRGICSDRDYWCYNFSRKSLEKNIRTTIDFFNENTPENINPKKIVWTRATKNNKNRGKKYVYDDEKIISAMYRPFCEEFFYYDSDLNEMMYQMKKIFPRGNEKNLIICIVHGEKNFSVFLTKKICDVQFQFNGQCFPLYYYEENVGNLFEKSKARRDNISDHIKNLAAKKYGISVLKKIPEKNYCIEKNTLSDEIFYYVYGFLHLRSYREKFSAELKKSLPRIFFVDEYEKFKKISSAGRELAEIHLNYEKFDAPAEVEVIIEKNNFYVKKMRLSKDKTTLNYNEYITIKNIPPRSFEYVVNGRSPLEWIIERYQIKIDSASGIENNPNDWCLEHGDEKYILKLILSSMTVAIKTLEIVENLPDVEF